MSDMVCPHAVHTTADNNTSRRTFAYFSNKLMWGFCVGIRDCLCMWEKRRGVGKERELWSCMWLCNPWCLLIFCLHQPSVQPAEQTDPCLSLSLSFNLSHILERNSSPRKREMMICWDEPQHCGLECSKMKIVGGGRIYVYLCLLKWVRDCGVHGEFG